MSKLLRRFRGKLLLEALLKSLVWGVTASCGCGFVYLFILHLISTEPRLIWSLIVFGVPFILTATLLFAVKYYPTAKRIAGRLDESGLEERAGTMLEFGAVQTEIAKLQREDAKKHIEQTEPKQIKLRFRKKPLILCAISLCLCIGLAFVPYTIMDVFAADNSTLSEEEAQMIADLIASLRQTVSDADVSDELKAKMESIVDQLEKDLAEADSLLDKIAQISGAESKIEELLKEAMSRLSIGAALRQFDSTGELGVAIENGNTDKVSTALSNMKERILALLGEEQSELLNTISTDINNALDLSGVDASDSLYQALKIFADALYGQMDEALAGKDITSEIDTAFSEAEEAILAALAEQAKVEEALKDFSDAMEDAKDDLLGNEKEENETGEKPEGEEGEKPEGEEGEKPEGEEGEKPEGEEGEKPEGEDGEKPEGEAPDGDAPAGDGEGEGSYGSMTEGIYDPTSGSVEYGEVFAAYYAEYLASLKDGEIPADLQTIIDQYYASLNQ